MQDLTALLVLKLKVEFNVILIIAVMSVCFMENKIVLIRLFVCFWFCFKFGKKSANLA